MWRYDPAPTGLARCRRPPRRAPRPASNTTPPPTGRGGTDRQAVEALARSVSGPSTPGHSRGAGRPNVEATQLEQQEHLGRPGTDAPNRRQASGDLFVTLPGQTSRGQNDRPVEHLGREIPQRRRLVGGQADGSKGLTRKGYQRFRLYVAVQGGNQPAVNSRRCRPGELLVDDCADQGGEMRLLGATEARRTRVCDQAGDDQVPGRQDSSRRCVGHSTLGLSHGGGCHGPKLATLGGC